MSVVSKNIFDLLGDDGDESPAPAKTAAAAPKKTETSATPAAPARNVPGAAPRGGAARGGARGGSYPSRGAPRNVYRDGNELRNSGPVSGDGNAEGTETPGGFDGERLPPSRKGNQGSVRDAHTKGPRGTRPARGGANASRTVTSGGHSSYGSGHYKGGKVPAQAGERRQFERRNQNGGTDSQKKVEHGWGANTGAAELKDEVEGEKDAQVEEAAPGTPAVEGEEAPAAEEAAAPVEPEEPEEVTKSYEEYLAEKAQAALDLAALGKKQVREVSTEVEGKAFVREALDEFFSGAGKKSGETAKTKAPKKEKVYIEFDGQFAAPAGSRPPRTDRDDRQGSSRGGPRGGRGGARGGAAAPAINANDTTAFPALGA
ncbi:hypothetical protein CI109_102104 [Kwoniella shandongensis]|uniref:Hyaluronan/mRNA-binding protein domain-containing protein n=1 Tax=Kwoniella shandongensis TaxID=1734106 RepID=A0AAJ8MVX4_9TREE